MFQRGIPTLRVRSRGYFVYINSKCAAYPPTHIATSFIRVQCNEEQRGRWYQHLFQLMIKHVALFLAECAIQKPRWVWWWRRFLLLPLAPLLFKYSSKYSLLHFFCFLFYIVLAVKYFVFVSPTTVNNSKCASGKFWAIVCFLRLKVHI